MTCHALQPAISRDTYEIRKRCTYTNEDWGEKETGKLLWMLKFYLTHWSKIKIGALRSSHQEPLSHYLHDPFVNIAFSNHHFNFLNDCIHRVSATITCKILHLLLNAWDLPNLCAVEEVKSRTVTIFASMLMYVLHTYAAHPDCLLENYQQHWKLPTEPNYCRKLKITLTQNSKLNLQGWKLDSGASSGWSKWLRQHVSS